MNIFDAYKQGTGQLLGGIGGLWQGLTGTSNATSQTLRDIGGQLTGGQRTYNQVPSLVPTANAQEPVYSEQVYNPGATYPISTGPTSTDGGGQVLGEGTETPSQPSGPSPEDIYRQQQIENISNKWNGYFSGLDQLLGGLPGQAETLQSTANIQAGQSEADLLASTQENKAALGKEGTKVEQNQVKTLKDIAENIRNLMQSGQNVLGAMGASGSAPGRFAYALTKLGSQQRGDVVTQTRQLMDNINDRLAKVGNIFTQEKQRINSDLGIAMNNIATWLADQQQAIQQAKLQGQLEKGTDIQNLTDNLYNIAVQKAQQYQTWFNDKSAALQTWALNNSTSLKEAIQKLQGQGAFMAQTPTYTPMTGSPFAPQQQTGGVSSGYGGVWGGQQLTDEEKRSLGLA